MNCICENELDVDCEYCNRLGMEGEELVEEEHPIQQKQYRLL